ncbi:MAG TPA: hypothetical protein VNZ93_22930 [Pseudorhodoplanes sp.]|nr:hypothetical protein [Pseudorhodoplanes sp.]
MADKQAKVLDNNQIRSLLTYAQTSRYPDRYRVIVMLRLPEQPNLHRPRATLALIYRCL